MDVLTTKSVCHKCGKPLSAQVFEQNRDLYMRRICPECGPFEVPFWKDADLYNKAYDLRHPALMPEGRLNLERGDAEPFLTTFAIDVTTRCNMQCPTCVTNAEPSKQADPSVEELLALIPDFSAKAGGFRPNISLIGGESAMRDDLADIIRGILAKGLVPRLNSNGLLLQDPKRLRRLWDAGLRWVILQFDGFKPGPSIAFRGKDYSSLKIEVIEALAQQGFAIHLAVMVQTGVNDAELGDILRFAAGHPHILRVSFYPRSDIGRFDRTEGGSTQAADVLASIERTTDNQVAVKDFLDSKRMGRLLFRLTGHPMFRQRVCIFPMLVLKHAERLVPAPRLLRPSGPLKEPAAFLKLLASAPKLMRYDSAAFKPDFLFVNIEKFYDWQAFDLDQARNCHHVYLSAQGAYPFCIYNSFHREAADEGGVRCLRL